MNDNTFLQLRNQLDENLKKLTKTNSEAFIVDVDKDELWEFYLASFPEGTNPIFRETTVNDCSCCRQFIKTVGAVVIINDSLEMETIWSKETRELNSEYGSVATAMNEYVLSKAIKDRFYHFQNKVGQDFNYEHLINGTSHKWEHFTHILNNHFVKPNHDIPTILNKHRTAKKTFERSMTELSLDAAKEVVDLIRANALYRGAEHLDSVVGFVKAKMAFDKLPVESRDLYLWENSTKAKNGNIKNSVIGSLIEDLSDGKKPLEVAVASFESKVAPSNYKRPTALITPAMVDKAQATVESLGIENSLSRRFAVQSDITINNVLYASRKAKKSMNAFDVMKDNIPLTLKKSDNKKLEEIPVAQFITEFLPKAQEISLLVENKHSDNMVSLISPIHQEAKSILKWNNNFSWSYNGEVTDTIKTRVKKAGGKVDGVLRASLSWHDSDDLDIHVVEPSGCKIDFSNKCNYSTSGSLDVDMNVSNDETCLKVDHENPVENICWSNINKMNNGRYTVKVHNYTKRNHGNSDGFVIELEDHTGKITSFFHAASLGNQQVVEVVSFDWTREDGITKVYSKFDSGTASRTIWGVKTQKYVPVKMIMNSPNHWDENKVGNKHMFFILDDCKTEETSRGFYNEFLNDNLHEHRKVFEVLGRQMRVEESDDQLSGVGFSETNHESVELKINTESGEKLIKVIL